MSPESQISQLERKLRTEIINLTAAKNGAYRERDLCVALVARLADALDHLGHREFEAWLGKHDPADETWDRDWLNIVFVQLPTGQLSWHIHDSELELFDFLPRGAGLGVWDGHTTEQKYERLRAALRAGGLEPGAL